GGEDEEGGIEAPAPKPVKVASNVRPKSILKKAAKKGGPVAAKSKHKKQRK
ncbi:hypothetical protein HK097_002226, partial [Rhizophlyctis rosea]